VSLFGAESLINAMCDGCAHGDIKPDVTFPDGGIDGKCSACGATGFPIRDVGYEKWRAEEDRARAEEKAAFEALPEVEQLRLELESARSVLGFWRRKYLRERERQAINKPCSCNGVTEACSQCTTIFPRSA
jgi:hypothetical protein